ncbi:microfibril-associated glycoprotein 4-like [Saccostrea echinata]|uniref:microfibril-associated glycoprotein 4-like n=1 Tax=Saccostrea echinata TaxID=191078 RepID=UPI002A813F36|nr:microfibril-associated glycoprotein 4-like [Saccostrea echinata]
MPVHLLEVNQVMPLGYTNNLAGCHLVTFANRSIFTFRINDENRCILSFLFDENTSQNGFSQCTAYKFKGECGSDAIYNRYSGNCVKCSPNCECKDCQDIRLIHGDVTGQHSLKIDGRTVSVWCDMDTDDGGWLVIQRRLDGSLNFYRGWNDYKNGFGSPSGEFWLGLEDLHAITSQGGYDLRIDMKYNSQSFYVQYSDFTIAPESDNYRMSYSLFKAGSTGNDLSWHNGQPFTTFDRDNDANEEKYDDPNCATAFYGAWWYASCHNSNLNGHYGNTSFGKGINWNHITGYYSSLSRVEMKIKKQQGS